MSNAPNKAVGINQILETTKMVGPAGEVLVNTIVVEHYKSQGYKLPGEQPKGGDCSDQVHDWKQYNIKDLRKHAKAAKIDFTNEMTEEDLRNLLCSSKYVPQAN